LAKYGPALALELARERYERKGDDAKKRLLHVQVRTRLLILNSNEKRPFWAIYISMIIVPRQARDKPRKMLREKGVVARLRADVGSGWRS
jgi:hypothetical protein